MTFVAGMNSTTTAGSIGNAGVSYYAVGPGGTPGGYSNASSYTITGLAIHVTDWISTTGLKVNMCNAAGTSQRIAEFVPADGTGLIIKTVADYTYTANDDLYFDIVTTGGTGFVESYRTTTAFSCKTAAGSTYATPGNIDPVGDTDNANFEPFVYADGTLASSTHAGPLANGALIKKLVNGALIA